MQNIIDKKAFTDKVETLALTGKTYLESIVILMNEYDLDESEIPRVINGTLKQKLYTEALEDGLLVGKVSPALKQLL